MHTLPGLGFAQSHYTLTEQRRGHPALGIVNWVCLSLSLLVPLVPVTTINLADEKSCKWPRRAASYGTRILAGPVHPEEA